MIRTVKDLKDALESFEDHEVLVYRKSFPDGGFADYFMHAPNKFYPGGVVCLSSGQDASEDKAKSAQ